MKTTLKDFLNEYHCEFCDGDESEYIRPKDKLQHEANRLVGYGYDDAYIEAKLYTNRNWSMTQIKDAIKKARELAKIHNDKENNDSGIMSSHFNIKEIEEDNDETIINRKKNY